MPQTERGRLIAFLLLIILGTVAVLNLALGWVRWSDIQDEFFILLNLAAFWAVLGYVALRWLEKLSLRPTLALSFLASAGAASTVGFLVNQGWSFALLHLVTWVPALYINLRLSRRRAIRRALVTEYNRIASGRHYPW